MKIEKIQASKEKGVSDPRVAKLLAEAREKIYEAIAIQTGDPVEGVKKFFAGVEKANKEANNKEQKDVKQTDRQHTLFTNLVGTDDLVGICIIVGYQKKDADIEKVIPIKLLTSRVIEPLEVDILAAAAMSHETKNKNSAPDPAVVKVTDVAEAPTIAEEAVLAVTAIELPQEDIATAEAVENKEDIPL